MAPSDAPAKRPPITGLVMLLVLQSLFLVVVALPAFSPSSETNSPPPSPGPGAYAVLAVSLAGVVGALLIGLHKRIGLLLGLVPWVVGGLVFLVDLSDLSVQSAFDRTLCFVGTRLYAVLVVLNLYYLLRYLVHAPEKTFFT